MFWKLAVTTVSLSYWQQYIDQTERVGKRLFDDFANVMKIFIYKQLRPFELRQTIWKLEKKNSLEMANQESE